MHIKILISCSGLDFAYRQGDEVIVAEDLGKDLIAGGLAEEIAEPKPKEKQKPKAGGKANADA